ncbi:TolC family outer membrane protein [Orrella sp. 11846]|uniref:TolC family outer membrane protein n=1 Tax=Orrella sp. 11846 TaxID=3409913 RepID=UPI003B5AFF02
MKNTLLMSALLAVSAAQLTHAQTTTNLTEVVQQAVLSNPEIRAQFHDFQSALEGQKVRRGALLPEVNASAWVGQEWRGSGSGPNAGSSNWSRHGYSLQLRQLLFDGFSTWNDVKQLGFEKLAEYFDLLATVDKVASEAAMAYLDVQRYREQVKLAEDNYRVHQRTLGQLNERSASGVGKGVDRTQAQGRLSLAQSNLMAANGNLNDVTERFRRIVGLMPADTLLPVGDVSKSIVRGQKNFSTSMRNNPGLLSKQALFQAADAGVDSARGKFSPTAELRAATGKDRGKPDDIYRDAHSSNVELVVSMNLYRGGSDRARVRQTVAQTYAARDVRDYTCRNLQQDLSVAWNNMARLNEQIPFLRQHQRSTSSVRHAYSQQFQIGERSLLDLLDTENELFDARRTLVDAEYNLKQVQMNWLTLSHELLPALKVAQPYEEKPSEFRELDLPSEAIDVCAQPLPDTTNLKPVRVQYRDNMQPPIIMQTEPITQN